MICFFLAENNLQRLVLELFGGATDTTSTAILWALAYFLHHPHVQENCYREIVTVVGKDRQPSIEDKAKMTYMEATIMETLRFSGTSPLAFPHSVSRDVHFEGYVIPRGAFVLPVLDTALRDAHVWEAPDEFRPDRFLSSQGELLQPEEWIPFGAGEGVCVFVCRQSCSLTEIGCYIVFCVCG